MEIFVYDRDFKRLGQIENHTSLQWNRKYYECGTFELHCPVTTQNLELLKPGNIITIGDKKEAAIIRGDQTEEESTLVNEIVRNGYFLPAYLGDRLTGAMFTFTGTVEDAMRYILAHMTETPYLEISEEQTGDTTQVTFQATYKNVLEYLTKLAKAAEIGFRIRPDFKNRKMVFETYKGTDRTQSQGNNSRVIFSESYGNLNQAKHTYSDETAYTKVIVGGQGEGTARTYVTVGGGTGFDLREVFLDAKDINADELTTAEYLEALKTRGREYLTENASVENFEAEVEADVNFIYGQDYDLGDIVTIKKKKWNTTQNLRITELCEVYEYGGMYVVPTFGDALPTQITWDD